MIIIVCGVDKSGKSTIIQDLVNERKRHHEDPIVLKLSQKPKDGTEVEKWKIKIAYQELFEQAKRLHEERLVIFDRAYPSEMVYSIKRGYDALEDKFWWEFDSKLGSKDLQNLKVLLIYCTAPTDLVKERMQKEREDYLKDDEVEQMQERYLQFLQKTYLPYIIVDTTKDRVANLTTVRNLIRNMKTQEFLK